MAELYSIVYMSLDSSFLWSICSNLSSTFNFLLSFHFLFFGCTHNMQHFWGQGSNPHHNYNQSHNSDNARSLTHWATGEFHHPFFFFKLKFVLFVCLFAAPVAYRSSQAITVAHWKYLFNTGSLTFCATGELPSLKLLYMVLDTNGNSGGNFSQRW